MSKQAKCKVCGEEYKKYMSTQKVCTIRCAAELVKQSNDKAFRKETKKLKEKIKSRSQWLKEAQSVFNKFIRLRDIKDPCISCGRHHNGQYHAGHYRSVGSTPELRFCEENNHKQCAPCNNHLSGNLISYRINLIKKIGIDRVEAIESKHDAKKYTIDDIKLIINIYKNKIKGLK